jgi:hypothetical protein
MSTNYIPRGEEPTFADLAETPGVVGDPQGLPGLRVFRKGITLDQLVASPAPTEFNPQAEYVLTDGTNTLHLNFSPDGRLLSADRFGANDPEELLNWLGDMSSEHDDDYWDIDAQRNPDNSEAAIEAAVDGVVADLLEEEPMEDEATARQREYERQWKLAQTSARQRPDWAVIRNAVAQAMVADGATEVGSSDVNHGVMRFWKDYGGDWDAFLKDHPLQEPEAMCDNCGSASHHTDECPYSFGANPQ